jgi:hypothetical protein
VVAAVVTVAGGAVLGVWVLVGSSPGRSAAHGAGDTSIRATAPTAGSSAALVSPAVGSSPAGSSVPGLPAATPSPAVSAPAVSDPAVSHPAGSPPSASHSAVSHPAVPPGAPAPGATSVPSSSASAVGNGRWRPTPGITWQWQLSGIVDTSVNAQVYDIDAETPAATVAQLHAMGRRVICYVDVGSWEPDRADADKFPASVRGKKLDGWDENWLDIRQVSVLRPLIAARFDVCKSKGFDAIEPDNVDGYTNDTGFPLTANDQLAYDTMVAQLAHQRGLAVALKNDIDQASTLAPSFDFAINEQCVEYDECDALEPFVVAGKAVLHVEYNESLTAFCGKLPGFSSMRKRLSLDAWREACP